MDDLVQFLRARLDEDAEVARAAHGRVDGPLGVRWWTPEEIKTRLWGDQIHMSDAVHIARHAPARVLREVEAKRAIIGTIEQALKEAEFPDHLVSRPARVALLLLEPIGRQLAAIHADHPDYLEAWRP